MRRPLILATCALALVAAGCGGSSKKSTTTAPAASSSSSSASGADANLLSGIKSQTGPTKLDLALKILDDAISEVETGRG